MEKLERENRQLKLQLENVNKSLAAALEREDIKTKALKEIKEHLALFGKTFSKVAIPSSATPSPIIRSPAKVL